MALARKTAANGDGFEPGAVVAGKYSLRRVLGEGGMGAVWLARNDALDADVALKLIQREAATPAAATRLFREARAAARLSHPGIVRVYDFGHTQAGDPFIVMEALQGGSLRDLLDERTRLPATEAVRVVVPVGEALAFAHAKGIVHRDLKPDNVMLAIDGDRRIPKLVDFGVAKLRIDDLPRNVTIPGTLVGSPEYMSPEQARGREDVDASTDVWALCVVLFELVTGRRPFAGSNYNALLTAIIEDTPPGIHELGGGDAALAAIVARGLAKRREDRWPSMRALVDALAAWARGNGIATDISGAALPGEPAAANEPRPIAVRTRSDVPPPPAFPTATAARSRDGAPEQARRPTAARSEDGAGVLSIVPARFESRGSKRSAAAAIGVGLVLAIAVGGAVLHAATRSHPRDSARVIAAVPRLETAPSASDGPSPSASSEAAPSVAPPRARSVATSTPEPPRKTSEDLKRSRMPLPPTEPNF